MILSTQVFSDTLKSVELREMACDGIENELEMEDFQTKYEIEYEDDIIVLDNFQLKCSESVKSFEVVEVIKNERANKVTKISVNLDLDLKDELNITSELSFTRTAFDPNTGEISLGKWELYISNFNFKLGINVVRRIAQVIADSAEVQNGGAGIYDYKLVGFSVKKTLSKLNKEVRRENKENSCQSTEFNEDSLDGLNDVIDNNHDFGYMADLVLLLKRQGLIVSVLSNESDEWEESCAHNNFEIYLTNGILISLGYDFTT